MGANTYKCNKCGDKITYAGTPNLTPCPRGGNHVWVKISQRFVNWFRQMFE